MSTPALPTGVRRVEEVPAAGTLPLHPVPGWIERFPWLVHGTTGRGDDGTGRGDEGPAGRPAGFDLGLSGGTPVREALDRWRALREATGFGRAVHALQVHGRELLMHEETAPGLFITEGVDGHLTDRPGILLTVSVADCVPISLVDPERRRVALLHGGWRGTAAGVVPAGLARLGGDASAVHAHLGPAICGECYEVGPEVHEALGLAVPDGNTPVDVRAVQARTLVEAGVPAGQVTVSRHCTRCGDGFFSHRGGDRGRQVGVLGIR